MSRSCSWVRRGGHGCGAIADGQANRPVSAQAGARAGAAREARAETGEERRARGRAPRRRQPAGRDRRGAGRRVTRFEGGDALEGAAVLGYEETLEALLSLIG